MRNFTRLFVLLFALCVPVVSRAQGVERPWWYLLEEGKNLFREGSYGDALLRFEDARRARGARFTQMEQSLVLLFSTPELRRLGDSLERAEAYIAEHGEAGAQGILSELYYRVRREALGGSVARVFEELDRLKGYPEAEYWLGECYRAEGELGLALGQYERAWALRGLLETPGFDAEILYKITGVLRQRQEYQEMERRAREIIEGAGPNGVMRDEYWAGAQGVRIRAAMARILENEGVSRFLSLYRHNNTVTERAHRLLGFFYYASSRFAPAAEHLMFAFLIQNTVLLDEVLRRQFDYTFTSLDNLMAYVRNRPEFAAFLEETEYFRTVYYLSAALYAAGKTRPALELWAFLAASSDAGVWGVRARANRTPLIDPAIEMP